MARGSPMGQGKVTEMREMNVIKAYGRCHCGKVAFEISLPSTISVQHCNCSICSMSGYIHLIVPGGDFQLVRGREYLTEYAFNTGIARHLFCSVCGVKSFYVPRSNPDGFSVNLRCLELPETVTVKEEHFDGQNWELHGENLRHLSKLES